MKSKEIEMKIIILNPEELEKAKEEFTKNVIKAYKQKQLTTDKQGWKAFKK